MPLLPFACRDVLRDGRGAGLRQPAENVGRRHGALGRSFRLRKRWTLLHDGYDRLGRASGFDYYVSSDLVAWEYGGPLFRKSPAHFGAGAFWAPEVERYEGRFYMTYSCLEPERGVLLSCLAVSDRPEGPFEELYTPWFDLGFRRSTATFSSTTIRSIRPTSISARTETATGTLSARTGS